MRLIRAELFKIRTTSLWWIMGIVLAPLYAASILVNWLTANLSDAAADQSDQVRVTLEPLNVATNLYTSGQYFGILIVLLLSAMVVTNEFFHLTATTTFLVTPRREAVILAKFGAAIVVGLIIWALTTVLNLIFAPLILDHLGLGTQLGEPAVWRAIALNALAYALWAILGVGAGVLIRSQIAATLVLAITYTVGEQAVGVIFLLLSDNVAKWFEKLQVIVPTTASQLMVSGTELPGNPPRWVGAAVLIAYAVVGGVIGTVITKSRDIS
jgi:ABC-2 type transport system permease protein